MESSYYYKFLKRQGTSFIINFLDENNQGQLPPGYYINSLKVGHVFLYDLAKEVNQIKYDTNKIWFRKKMYDEQRFNEKSERGIVDFNTLLDPNYPIYTVVRDPIKKIYSGIVQTTLIGYQIKTTLSNFDFSKHPKIIEIADTYDLFDDWRIPIDTYEPYVFDYLIEVLGKWWNTHLVYDQHLSLYFTAMNTLIKNHPTLNFNILQLGDINTTKLTTEHIYKQKHSNSIWYNTIDKVLSSDKLNSRGKSYIRQFIDLETFNYNELIAR